MRSVCVFSLSKSISLGVAVADDFFGGLFRNDAETRLRPRQRRFEVEIFLHAVLVGEYPPHCLGREDVAEHGGVDQGRGHGLSNLGIVSRTRCSTK